MDAPINKPPKAETDTKTDVELYIFDRRSSESPETKLRVKNISHFKEFHTSIKEALSISNNDFVISTTSREEINSDATMDLIENGDTLYILHKMDQELCAPAQERVEYLPHYDTIVKGGMYEYYASEGQNPLSYAFAELIDNALAATALNKGPRKIELRLYVDDSAATGKNCIIVLDNGKGMTSRQLNNWAIYRLSKFTRRRHRADEGKREDDSPDSTPVSSAADDSINLAELQAPRFMNSDISYFGVGGKQAVFFIGDATRMISKPKGSKDVHELSISKEEFERKERTHQSIYAGYIRNRQPGDASHLSPEDDHVVKLVKEECGRESFTAVVIQGINTEHQTFLKQCFHMWTRQLAHIYHFYLHGPDGNINTDKPQQGDFSNIDIQVNMYVRGVCAKSVNLRTIDDDMQTQYARSAVSTFDFKAYVDCNTTSEGVSGQTSIEGIIRYHPFKYDRETYPVDVYSLRRDAFPEDDHGYAVNNRPARGRRPIFEAFWNGRLIPYTLIEDFEWCSLPKRQKNVPMECYNRISGVVWTNDSFQVSTNKLTFLDLELKLRDKNTNFVRTVQGHEKRTNIDKEFQNWLKECNEEYDKQILFSGNQGIVSRPDQPKFKQTPWTKFCNVEWDNRNFEIGQMVRILRTTPVVYGTIEAFYLYGEHEGDVYATGGDIQLLQEPHSLYADTRFVSLNKLDRNASPHQIEQYIEEEEAKLPDHLLVSFPNDMGVKNNEKRLAGLIIGDIKVEICNRRGEKINKIPSSTSGSKKLFVNLKVIWHAPGKDEVLVDLLSQHGKTWPYWFKRMDCAKNLGSYTLNLSTVLNEYGNTNFAGHELPSHTIKFTVTEAGAHKFALGSLDDGPFKVGVPFNIPLEFYDKYNNRTSAPADIKPVLDADGLELSYENVQVKGQGCSIKGVMASGTVNSSAGKIFNLKLSLPGLDLSQTLKLRLLPGPAVKLFVSPETDQRIENGGCPSFRVEVQDMAGNLTSGGKLNVLSRMTGASNLPTYSVDCSATGSAVLTGKPVLVKNMTGEKRLITLFDLQGVRNMKAVERAVIVTPSTKASSMRLFYTKAGKQIEIKPGQVITEEAGSTIDTLSFEILNEVGDLVEIDEKLACKVKVNWAPKVTKECALVQKLPPIKVLHSTSDPKYCQASVMDGDGIDINFSVLACPGEITQMGLELKGDNSATVGQPFEGPLFLTFKDKYGNVTKLPPKLEKEVKFAGHAMKPGAVVSRCNEHKAEVKKLIFTTIGDQDVAITWGKTITYTKIKVVAGLPVALKIDDWDSSEPVNVFSGKPVLKRFIVSLNDAEGNLVNMKNVKVVLAKPSSKLKINSANSVMTNDYGCADFGLLSFSGPAGTYELQAKCQVGFTKLESSKLSIVIQANPDKAAALEIFHQQAKAPLMAGHSTIDFTVSVMSETGDPLVSASSDYLSMQFAKVQPESVVKTGPGSYMFKKCLMPYTAGSYTVTFCFNDGKCNIKSNPLNLNVKPGHPAALLAKGQLITPTVSNGRSVSNRTLFKSLDLELRDEFGNCLKEDYDGEVKVQIISKTPGCEIPLFDNGVQMVLVSLVKGQCKLGNLMVKENSSGKDGAEYHLECTVQCAAIPKNKPLPPLEIPFLFYNDAKKQQQMAALSKERDALRGTVQAYKSMFNMHEQLVDELRAAVEESRREEQTVRSELSKQNIPGPQLASVAAVENLIETRTQAREQVLRTPRRMCGLVQADAQPGILGKLAHLALVQDSDIARVLSWHMAADMDCIITQTTAKAKEVYNKTDGKQQVLPLDSIFRKNLPDWDKPLPLARFNPGFKAPGNPVYARNLLEFHKEEENCKIVFGMLLGDTLILDTLDHANTYRQMLVKYTHCPTILTRTGDRIRSNGKFGGAMNKAPSIDKLRGCVFGQPLPITYHAICTQIESLGRYKSALLARAAATEDLQEQLNQQKQPEAKAKMKEMKEAEHRLKEVENQLGMVASSKQINANQTNRRRSEATPVSTSALKKPKLEPDALSTTPQTSETNTRAATSAPAKLKAGSGRQRGTARSLLSSPTRAAAETVQDNSDSPARTSRRIASMTAVLPLDGHKKLKKM